MMLTHSGLSTLLKDKNATINFCGHDFDFKGVSRSEMANSIILHIEAIAYPYEKFDLLTEFVAD